MITCKVCGTENEQGAAFCGSCGSFLEWNAEPSTPAAASGDAPTQVSPAAPVPPAGAPPATTSAAPAPEAVPAAGMVVCPACGTPNEPTRTYCRRCATELAPASAEPPPPAPVPGRSGPPLALLGGLAAIVVLGALAAVFFLPGLSPGGSAATAPTASNGSPVAGSASVAPSVMGTTPGESSGSGAPPTPAPTASPTPAPSLPSLTGQIVFTTVKKGNADVRVWDAGDRTTHKLAAGSGNQSDASWRWDRSAVVYVTANGLRIINADGSRPAVPDLTHHAVDRHPAWSPDGTLVAFASTATHGQGPSSNSLDIYTRPVADNTVTHRLTDDPAADWDPNWSPDGSTIVFASKRQGDARLFLMDADGGHQRLLKLGPGIYDDPSFSPDGQWLAFTRRDTANAPKALYIVHPDGTGMRRLSSSTVNENDPTWSPDSSAIAFVRTEAGSPIVIVDVATGAELWRFRVNGALNQQPDWR